MIESNIPGRPLTKEECIQKYKMKQFMTVKGPIYVNPKDIKSIYKGRMYFYDGSYIKLSSKGVRK